MLEFFNQRHSPDQLFSSLVIGLMLGVVPMLSPLAWLWLLIILVFRVNYILVGLGWGFGEWIGVSALALFNQLGEAVFQLAWLEPLWQSMYEQIFWRLVQFNESYWMGASLTSLAIGILAILMTILTRLGWRLGSKKRSQSSKPASKRGFLNKLTSLVAIQWLMRRLIHPTANQRNGLLGWFNWQATTVATGLFIVMGVGSLVVLNERLTPMVQKQLQQHWQAPVNIGRIQLSLDPFGLIIHDVSLMNRLDTEQTAIHATKMRLTMDPYQLVSARFIVNQWVIDGVTIHPQHLAVKSAETRSLAASLDPSLAPSSRQTIASSPVVQKIIQQERLQTKVAIANIDAELLQAQNTLHQLGELRHSQQQLSDIEEQIDQLIESNSGQVNATTETAHIKVTIEDELKRLESQRQPLNQHIQNVIAQLTALTRLPAEDRHRLRSQYTIAFSNADRLGQLFLAKDRTAQLMPLAQKYVVAQAFVAELTDFYHQARQQLQRPPWLEEWLMYSKPIHFMDADPQPPFNIQQLHIIGAEQDFELKLNNVNFDQPLSQLITDGRLRLGDQNFQIEVNYSHADPHHHVVTIQQQDALNTLEDVDLINSDNLTLAISSGTLSEDMNAQIFADGRLVGQLNQHFDKIRWNIEKSNQSPLTRFNPINFQRLQSFNMQTYLRGSISNPTITIESSLDPLFNRQLQAFTQQTNQRLSVDIEQQLNQLARHTLTSARQQLNQINSKEKRIKALQQQWQQQLQKLI